MVGKFVDELLECAATASRLMRLRYRKLMDKIDREIERLKEMEKRYSE